MPDARFTDTVTPVVRPAVAGPRALLGVPPPRPALRSDHEPPAPPARAPRPRAVVCCAGLWLASGAAGVLALLAALTGYDRVHAALTASATAQHPTASADLIQSGVRATVLLAVVPCVALVIATVLWTALLLGRRRWARWALVVTGLLTVLFADLAWEVLGGNAPLTTAGLGVQVALIAAGTLALFNRSVRGWPARRSG